ncbi:methylenetetrahydrofolate dehydrogenase [candidate division KD3-62 bacterium DG_56]|uniref:Bifunctional protein FolD n=1 Tax=candidate division KD3-62 bacterium DG_56 TaxID=1704032 RepID=A0A0S7XI03_9BACT|nr:MAG: methylenetetrahydrofolate dehydrogenase [candidate division KD3-62 bacterium DG_56]
MPAQLLKGKPIADAIKDGLAKDIETLKARGAELTLAAIQVGEDEASATYARSQQKQAEALGIGYQLHQLPGDASQDALHAFINDLNENGSVTGIILQLPLPPHLDVGAARSMLPMTKDVDCLSPASMGLVAIGEGRLLPCTPMAAMELIKSTGVNLRGCEVTLVGYGAVGRPLALLLLPDFPTLTLCDLGTSEAGRLAEHVGNADLLITAVGAKPGLIKGAWVKQGAIVIDISIIPVEGGLAGDVEFDAAVERASQITPVPGGVGPLTVAMLLRNTVEAAKWQLES